MLMINEGNYIDYRYFDAYNITPRYEFGHGLSYTTFNYTNLSIASPSTSLPTYPTGTPSVGGPPKTSGTPWCGSAPRSTNTAPLDGAEVPQLYIGFPTEAKQPMRATAWV